MRRVCTGHVVREYARSKCGNKMMGVRAYRDSLFLDNFDCAWVGGDTIETLVDTVPFYSSSSELLSSKLDKAMIRFAFGAGTAADMGCGDGDSGSSKGSSSSDEYLSSSFVYSVALLDALSAVCWATFIPPKFNDGSEGCETEAVGGLMGAGGDEASGSSKAVSSSADDEEVVDPPAKSL